jgi:hypothetical protein
MEVREDWEKEVKGHTSDNAVGNAGPDMPMKVREQARKGRRDSERSAMSAISYLLSKYYQLINSQVRM